MKHIFLSFFLFISFANAQNFETIFEKSDGKETATYQQTIEFYQKLAKQYSEITLNEIGMTDSGKPLHLVIFNSSGNTDLKTLINTTKNTILINNGIHPGEPDGIDASMMFIRDIVQNKDLKKKLKNIVVCIIPIYNVGGSLNRNSTSRVNQNGPKSYGYRGNARNYDLNRDFIKNDTKNGQSFAKIFHLIDPDIFIDNHVSNGADYQYALTHLFTQHNKLGGELGTFLNNKMIPDFENSLENKNLIITPYVNVFNRVPDDGFSQFFDSPRYSTGYTSLFNTLGFMVETHMLKPYDQRVKGTYEILFSTLDFLNENGDEISKMRKKASSYILNKKTYPIQWEIDSSKTTTLNFKGYEGNFITSEVTGLKRLKYDRSKPFTKPITYYNYFKPKKEIAIPEAYIISKGNWKIINQLDINKIEYQEINTDTLISVEIYHIEDYQTVKKPFEGHYLHYNTNISKKTEKLNFHKGDIFISTKQNGIRYLMETLEPEAPDSFFNWNFFDTILQKKEGFSPYVFEDVALDILKDNPKLKSDFEQLKKEDQDFSKNWYEQLSYIFKNSAYASKVFMKYPVYRVLK